MRLLLVEDHRALSEMIEEHLERVGFAVDPVPSAEDARAALNVTAYDIIVLDLGLPGADGMTVLDHVRRCDALRVPVLILTARDPLGAGSKASTAVRTIISSSHSTCRNWKHAFGPS